MCQYNFIRYYLCSYMVKLFNYTRLLGFNPTQIIGLLAYCKLYCGSRSTVHIMDPDPNYVHTVNI